ncbi:sulfate reduction electron transfer complex DsrMKJOP subunit DsrJ [Chloroflexota bacterium]
MYDAKYIIPGIIIFLCIVIFPILFSVGSGNAEYVPEPEIVTEEIQCVESAKYMRDNHTDLIIDWRESVVREGNRTYVASDGLEYDMSLTGTCLSCHANKSQFCDQCHDYAGVKPDCWSCHNIPEEG